ncbi:electron transfer flavoprotein subunit alpha/FixB family protein [Halobaculum limi]|uniref:electron transfer flavoprotein subunit alpha/FixB family protein n=1 Tax=Halobaculum limi TaxID=3031916 RepID=UPI0024063914|nr:electron transfer flavoprotein subunit alpha/FixB family protein [Halobaculum sp. YSMS11]
MPDIDPGEFDIAELGPKVRAIDDTAELEALLAAERDGRDRDAVITVIQSRLEAVAAEEDDTGDDEDATGDVDLAEMSLAEIGNRLREIDDPAHLRSLRDEEQSGENRDTVVRLIERRLDSVDDSEDGVSDEGTERASPEERHPDLDHPTADKRHVRALPDGTFGDMWVYCETQAGYLLSVSRELLGKARDLTDEYNEAYVGADDDPERVVAVLIGDDVARHADECIACGADVVVYHEDERLSRFLHKPYTELFADMARWGAVTPARSEDREPSPPRDADWRDYDEPRYVLFPATNNGRDLSAQVQAELDSGLASDCSGLFIEDARISNPVKTGEAGSQRTFERVLHMKRPDFSGFEYSTILCLDNPDREFHPQGGSVIPGSFEVPDPDPTREGLVVEHDLPLDDDWFRVQVTDFDRLDSGVDLSGHDVVVAVGRGIGTNPTRGVELAVDLAAAFEDADVGVSRGIVTGSYEFAGHVEQYTHEDRQIGETGQVVKPTVYIAAGISGAVQHKVGCDEADTIIAINTDPEARIRDWCDYFIEGDLFEVLPRLTEAVATTDRGAAAVADGGAATPTTDSADGGDDDE